MCFVSTGDATKTKERPLSNMLFLAAVAYRERWHRDEQVHEVGTSTWVLALTPRKATTHVDERVYGPHGNIIGSCTSLCVASRIGRPGGSSPLRKCNHGEKET